MKKIALISIVIITSALLFSNVAFAADAPLSIFSKDICDPSLPTNVAGSCGFSGFAAVVQNIIKWLTAIGLSLAAILIAYGGLLILTSGGNEEKLKQGKKIITGMVVAIIITFLAYFIVKGVFTYLKVDPDYAKFNL